MIMSVRIPARPGLLSGQFRYPPIHVTETSWVLVDLEDPKVRSVVLQFVPSHIRLEQGRERELAEAGLELVGGRLFDRRAEAAKAEADAAAAAAQEAALAAEAKAKKAPRAEK